MERRWRGRASCGAAGQRLLLAAAVCLVLTAGPAEAQAPGSRVLGFVEGSALKFIDTTGRVLAVLPVSAVAQQFSVSDDGSKIVYSVAGPYGGNYVVWLYDIADGIHTQLFSQDWCQTIAWLPGSDSQFVFAGPDASLYRYDVPSGSVTLWQGDDVILSQFGLGVYRGGIVWDGTASAVLVRIGADYGGGDIILRADACNADPSHHLCNLRAFSPTYGGSSSWANVSFSPALTSAGDFGYYVERVNWTEHRLVRKSLSTAAETVIATTANNSRGLDSPAVVSAGQVAVLAPAPDNRSDVWLCGTTPGTCATIYPGISSAGWLSAVPLVGPFAAWVTSAPGTVQLATTGTAVLESAGSVAVSVTRVGGAAGPVSVTLSTVNGTAVAGLDYAAVSQTVAFGDGDAEPKWITIPLTDDAVAEVTETFGVTLSNPTGGAILGAPGSVTVSILDEDTVDFASRQVYLAEGGYLLRLSPDGVVLGQVPTNPAVALHMFDVSEDGSRVVYCNGGDFAEVWLLEAATGDNRKVMDAPWCGTLRWLPGSNTSFVFNRQDGKLYRHNLETLSTTLWQDADTLAPWPVNVFRGGIDFDASGTRIVFRAGTAAWGNDMVAFGWACAPDPSHRVCDLQGATPPGQDWERISYAPAISASGTHMYYLKRDTPAQGQVVRRRLPSTVGGAWGPEEILRSIPSGTEPYLATLDLFDDSRLLYVGPNATVDAWSLYSCTLSPLACVEVYQAPTWVAHVSAGPPLVQIAAGPPVGAEILIAESGRIKRLSASGRVLGTLGTDPAVPVAHFDVSADGSRVAYCSGGDPGVMWLLEVATGQNRRLFDAPWCSVIKWLRDSATEFLFSASDGSIGRHDLSTGTTTTWQATDGLWSFGTNMYRGAIDWDEAGARVLLRTGQAYGGGDRVLYGTACAPDPDHHVCDLQALTGPGSGWDVIGHAPAITRTGLHAYYLKRLSRAEGQLARRALPAVSGETIGTEEVLLSVASGAERYLGLLDLFDDTHLVYVGESESGGAWAVKYCTVSPFACLEIYRTSTGLSQLLVTPALATPLESSLTAIAPATGPTAGGTTVTIGGTRLAEVVAVTFGGAAATIASARDTSITVLTPPGVAGARDVAVILESGTILREGGFTYVASADIADQRVGAPAAAEASTVQPSLSLDARYLAFASGAAFDDGDTNGAMDVYVRDRATGAVVRVSVGPAGALADGPSERPRLSGDGRFVAFASSASNLVFDDVNGVADVFVHDRDTDADGIFDEAGGRETFRVSLASNGQQADAASGQPDLSTDGMWVAFVSSASNLSPDASSGIEHVYLHHWPSRQTRRVSVGYDGTEANGPSRAPALSAAGKVVVFASDASNLVPLDTNGLRDVFLYDRAGAATLRVSTAATASPVLAGTVAAFLGDADADGASDSPSVDDAGDTLAFQTGASNIVPAANPSGSSTQVVVVDIQHQIRLLISQGLAGGGGGNGDSGSPEVGGSGESVTFHSEATDLVPDDGNDARDVFIAPVVVDGGAPDVERVSLDREGDEAGQQSGGGVLSGDGHFVAFESDASLTRETENSTVTNVFVRGVSLAVAGVTPTVAEAFAPATVVVTGTGFADGVKVFIGGAPTGVRRDSSGQLTVQVPGFATPGAVDVVVRNPDGQQVIRRRLFTVLAVNAADADLDGLPDAWERQHGLDALSSDGPAGAGGDPDGDGATNLAEYTQGTHPRGTFVGYFAEGATGAFFDTELGLSNSSASAARVLLRFQRSDGHEVPWVLTVPATGASALRVGQVPGLEEAEFSTVVESDVRLALTRTMTWDKTRAFGSHEEVALLAPALTWYFAEGSTNAGFQLFYLVQNPNATEVTVEFTFLLPEGGPVKKRYTVQPKSRFNVWVNQVPELASTDTSAVVRVTAGGPVIVERAMYLDTQGLFFGAGHESAGVQAPSSSWFLAEGATGPYFDLFLLFANPSPSTPAKVTATYLLPGGATVQKAYVVAPQSRRTVWVDYEDPVLADTAVSTTVVADAPILVERAMWWPGGFGAWHEAHDSFGATVTGTAWGLGGGAVGGAPLNMQTYVLVANTASHEARVVVTLLFTDGTPAVAREFVVPATSRFNVDVGALFREDGVLGRSFGVHVESVPHAGQPPAQIVVEQAVYSDDAAGRRWAAGGNALATRIR